MLLDEHAVLKISDFGLSALYGCEGLGAALRRGGQPQGAAGWLTAALCVSRLEHAAAHHLRHAKLRCA